MTRTTRSVRRPACTWGLVSAVLLGLLAWSPVPTEARADGTVGRLNAPFQNVPDQRRSDLILLPLLAALPEPPSALATVEDAMRLSARDSGWSAASVWAESAPARAVLEAIERVTRERDFRIAYAFAQPYGAEGVPIDIIAAGLYTELGDPPLLAGARHQYMDALTLAAKLSHVEATRLAASGEVRAAVDVLIRWAAFSRQMGDRAFAREWVWGMTQIALAMERIRDVVYVDALAQRRFTPRDAEEVIAVLDPIGGFLGLERLAPPRGDRAAAEQIAERVLTASGARTDLFATTLARIGASERPLRLFGEASRYERGSGGHVGLGEARRVIEGVFGDLETRWSLAVDNPRLVQPFATDRLARPDVQAIAAAVRARGWDPTELMAMRDVVRVEVVGTRHALGIMGYRAAFGSFPPQISSIRPRWLPAIEADPLNRDRTRGRVPPLEFFVPIRDTRASREPHVVVGTGYFGTAFSVRLFDDTFVLYSVGFDGQRNFGERIENNWREAGRNQDYLIWPPVISLSRQAASGG